MVFKIDKTNKTTALFKVDNNIKQFTIQLKIFHK